MTVGEKVWRCALALCGVRFRLQGRDPATGLDCVGVVLAAYGCAGVRLSAADDYALRGFPFARVVTELESNGLQRVQGQPEMGDIGLFLLPARQIHLALIAPDRLIHADALLRRTVEAPTNRLPAPNLSWRWIEKG